MLVLLRAPNRPTARLFATRGPTTKTVKSGTFPARRHAIQLPKAESKFRTNSNEYVPNAKQQSMFFFRFSFLISFQIYSSNWIVISLKMMQLRCGQRMNNWKSTLLDFEFLHLKGKGKNKKNEQQTDQRPEKRKRKKFVYDICSFFFLLSDWFFFSFLLLFFSCFLCLALFFFYCLPVFFIFCIFFFCLSFDSLIFNKTSLWKNDKCVSKTWFSCEIICALYFIKKIRI